MASERCCTTVFRPGGSFRGRQCSKASTVTREGKSYCKTHDPVEVEKKHAERDKKWRAEMAADDAKRRKANCVVRSQPLLLHALTRIIADLPVKRDWLDPELEKAAREAILIAQGEYINA